MPLHCFILLFIIKFINFCFLFVLLTLSLSPYFNTCSTLESRWQCSQDKQEDGRRCHDEASPHHNHILCWDNPPWQGDTAPDVPTPCTHDSSIHIPCHRPSDTWLWDTRPGHVCISWHWNTCDNDDGLVPAPGQWQPSLGPWFVLDLVSQRLYHKRGQEDSSGQCPGHICWLVTQLSSICQVWQVANYITV